MIEQIFFSLSFCSHKKWEGRNTQKTWFFQDKLHAEHKFTWRNRNLLPSQPRLICQSVSVSVRACRLGIQRKMAQAQQIWSIILLVSI
jgi:hypothetical protein